jgi:hypothetical protein
MIRSLGEIQKRWDEMAGKLSWSSLGGDVGTLNQMGAEYVVTDGIAFSGSAIAAGLGFTPTLSSANMKISGMSRRSDTDFNIRDGHEIDWSTVTVKGYQGSMTGDDIYGRRYIPAGMWMGEPDVDRKFGSNVKTDPFGNMVIDYYSSKSRDYVTVNYGMPTNETAEEAGEAFTLTDWDSYALNSSINDTQKALLTGYRDQTVNIGDTAPPFLLLSREIFYHRVPVRICVDQEYHFFNEMGNYRKVLRQDGHVNYNADVDISTSGAALQAIVDSLKVNAANMSAFSDVGNDEVG